MLSPFMSSAINVALPAIAAEFHVDAVTLNWIATVYLLAAGALLLPFGRLADMIGRKRIFLIGMALYSVTTFLCAIAPSITFLLVIRVVQGAASAMLFGTSVAIVTSVFEPHERGKALGINVAATYLGLSFGPVAGGALVQYVGWRGIFFVQIPVALLVIVLVVWRLKGEWKSEVRKKLDVAGSIIYVGLLVAAMYGVSILPSLPGFLYLGAGLLGAVLFLERQRRIAYPLLDVSLFVKNPGFGSANAAALLNYMATFAVTFLLSLYLQYVRGLPAGEAGLILVSQPIVQAILSPFAGRMSDRAQPRIVASFGMLLTVAGLLGLSFIDAATPFSGIIIWLALLGVGFAFFSSPNTNGALRDVDKSAYGVASATLGTMRVLGQMLSMGISLLIFSVKIGHQLLSGVASGAIVESVRLAFLVSAFLCVAGVVFSLRGGRPRTEQS
ncbi:MAG TPA: MFS transporter [Spirochaetia bacterium]|nr:MFS transporter [Spirochaetia bacterium]